MRKAARSATPAVIVSVKPLMTIYTKTGDTGRTSLFGGKRVLKCEKLVDICGSLDELNSWIGLVASELKVVEVQSFLFLIQSDLFTIGSILAGSPGEIGPLNARVGQMETKIDVLERELPKLTNFVLPGGNWLAADTHIARSICRRVERQAVALVQKQAVDVRILKYLNRLSDLLFMLARFINKQAGIEEKTWSGIKK